MRAIPPVTITDARLLSSTVPEIASAPYNGATTYALNVAASVAGALGAITEYRSLQAANSGHSPATSPTWWQRVGDTYQVYSSGATYAVGERVIDTVNHRVFESTGAGNLGNALTNTVYWFKVGATNRWAMFDLKTRQRTISPIPITVVLSAGVRCDSFGLGHIRANAVDIAVSSTGTEVYSLAADLNTREVSDAYDYCFKPFATKPAIVRFDMPPYTNAEISITVTASEGNAEVGACSIGAHAYLGDVEYNADDDAKNYSTVERNFDGTVGEMIPRFSIPSGAMTLWVDKSAVNSIRNLRADLNAVALFWSGIDDDSDGYFDALLKIGFYTQFKFNLDAPGKAQLTLAVEEV
ncbi:MAG: hypothetical protein PSU93_09290 [Methylobacter sp.]|uniref:Uncharacterized protein n=1 Tax=Candidatus Methylobacter titanis TaxID=3053457 RepID=A0AA43Q449_9GAMM|nr:hypothetical protein [Candidatus Methylobacter titanis]